MATYELSEEAIGKLSDALSKLGRLNPMIAETTQQWWYNTPPPVWQFAQITSLTTDACGTYPANVYYFDPVACSWSADAMASRLLPANGETLSESVYYMCRAAGYNGGGVTGDLVYVTMCCGGGSSSGWDFTWEDDTTFNGINNNYAIGTNAKRITGTSNGSITGVPAKPDGKPIKIKNAGTFKVSLLHNNSGSSSGNKIFTPNQDTLRLEPNESCFIQYDAKLDSGNGGWGVDARPAIYIQAGAAPSFPTAIDTGQLFLDYFTGTIWYYNGFGWYPVSPQSASSLPFGGQPGQSFWNTTDNQLYFYNGSSWYSPTAKDRLSQAAYPFTSISSSATVTDSGGWYNCTGGFYTITLGSMGSGFDGCHAGFRVSYNATGPITFTDYVGSFSFSKSAGQIAEFQYEYNGGTDRWYAFS